MHMHYTNISVSLVLHNKHIQSINQVMLLSKYVIFVFSSISEIFLDLYPKKKLKILHIFFFDNFFVHFQGVLWTTDMVFIYNAIHTKIVILFSNILNCCAAIEPTKKTKIK